MLTTQHSKSNKIKDIFQNFHLTLSLQSLAFGINIRLKKQF